MVQLSDGFVALPGGIGTFEEFFEVYTLQQMGFHSKPCGLLNINGYYSSLECMLDTAEKEGFLKTPHRNTIVRANNPGEMLDLMAKSETVELKEPQTSDIRMNGRKRQYTSERQPALLKCRCRSGLNDNRFFPATQKRQNPHSSV